MRSEKAASRAGDLRLACVLAGLWWCTGCQNQQPASTATQPALKMTNESLTFTGRIYPSRFNAHPDRACGHHAIVWRYGNAAPKALIEADISDVDIQERLESLGLVPGDNLSVAAWTKRHNPDHPAPDQHVQGSPLALTMSWEGLDEAVPLRAWFEETGPDDVNIRFGGHKALIPEWRSGCVVCMFSCPGGRMSNAAYTIRQQAREEKRFVADAASLPPDGTPVTITIRARRGATSPASEAGTSTLRAEAVVLPAGPPVSKEPPVSKTDAPVGQTNAAELISKLSDWRFEI